ncbi:AI-2E family transporter [Piscinibacter sp. XHJ-5]|uniref:AI-2E family transporter n=1 Tax=Piscinibacter sp. XHJ-5 TaxID=3037797 RepID=UPI0024533BCF|nr:AI-2E family transporter [Piscinibacter sp. XHJ-5]
MNQPDPPRPEDTPLAEDLPVHVLNMPRDVRSVSLAVIAVLGAVFVLHWASAVFIPLMIGVMFSYALDPVVDRLESWRIPRAVSAAVLLLGILSGTSAMVWSLADDANELLQSLPEAAQKLRQAMRSQKGPTLVPIDKVQEAAQQIERAAEESGGGPAPASRGVMRVQIEKPRFNVKDHLWSGTIGFIALVGQVAIVFFLTFFILASGDAFRRKMVKLAGPNFTEKRVTVQALDEITEQIQRYLLVQVFTSTVVGIITWLAFLWIGVEYAGVWGLLAGALNFIPYIGAIVVTGGASLVGFLQFGSMEMALVIAGTSFVIQSLEGYLLTPWLTSRASRMSPVAIFVGVLAWGWLWGAWGLILGVPILMAVKTVCDRIEGLKPIGELLGE